MVVDVGLVVVVATAAVLTLALAIICVPLRLQGLLVCGQNNNIGHLHSILRSWKH